MTITNAMYGLGGVRTFAPGSVVAREGDAGQREMYVLLSGSCGLYKHVGVAVPELVGMARAGDVIAMRSVFLGRPSKVTAVTHEPCIALALSRQDVPGLFAVQPECAAEIIESLCEALEAAENAARVSAALVSAASRPPYSLERHGSVFERQPRSHREPRGAMVPAHGSRLGAIKASSGGEAWASGAGGSIAGASRGAGSSASAGSDSSASAGSGSSASAGIGSAASAGIGSDASALSRAGVGGALVGAGATVASSGGAGAVALAAGVKKGAGAVWGGAGARAAASGATLAVSHRILAQKAAAAKPGAALAPSDSPSGVRGTPGSEERAKALFPHWHRHGLSLPMEQEDLSILFMREFRCPICKTSFRSPSPRTSRLVNIGEDQNLRVRYRGIEPLYYSVIVCPECWYSASAEMFAKAVAARAAGMGRKIDAFREAIDMQTNEVRDAFSVFASYFVALACAEHVFMDQEAALAGLWLRLGRLYDDCGAEEMSRCAAGEALRLYLEAYSRCDIGPRQLARVKYTIGNLAFRLGDSRQAKRFLFEVKTGRESSGALRELADQRLEELRAIERGACDNA